MSDNAGALADNDRVILLAPDKAGAWYIRGVIQENLGNADEAIAAYEHFLAAPGSRDQPNNRNEALRSVEKLKKDLVTDEDSPDFDDYPAQNIYRGKPAKANVGSHPRARKYRTMLREHAGEGPNFAGRYTVVTWGCGTACRELAIVDARTGTVAFPANLKYVDYNMVTDDSEPIEHRPGSRLLVVRGRPNGAGGTGIFCYLWDGRKLKLLKSMPKEWPR
jgi:tetratricopeptide (TPR) repeat protein